MYTRYPTVLSIFDLVPHNGQRLFTSLINNNYPKLFPRLIMLYPQNYITHRKYIVAMCENCSVVILHLIGLIVFATVRVQM